MLLTKYTGRASLTFILTAWISVGSAQTNEINISTTESCYSLNCLVSQAEMNFKKSFLFSTFEQNSGPYIVKAGPDAHGPFVVKAGQNASGPFVVKAGQDASGPFVVKAGQDMSGPFVVKADQGVSRPFLVNEVQERYLVSKGSM